ncbi:MAG: alkaline phosphatase family protein [Conexivisphaerales archaeon]
MKKIIYILLDGVGDRPIPQLNGLTPLEAAKTPGMDKLAERSVCGMVQTVGKGIAPESDIAVFHMLGYNLHENYFGRGVIEAIGAEMNFSTGDVAMRGNFATVSDDFTILDRRAGRDLSQEEGDELAKEVCEHVSISDLGASFEFVHTTGHRGVLVIHKENKLSASITNTDPAYQRLGTIGVAVKTKSGSRISECRPVVDTEQSRITAQLVNAFTLRAYKVLRGSRVNAKRISQGKKPANIILLRDAGDTYPKIETLHEKFKLSFAAIVDMPVELGISKLTGFDVIRSSSQKNFREKVEKTVSALVDHDVVYIHLKGPDEPGHDGLWKDKVEIIEQIDSEYFSPLLGKVDFENIIFAISADHATPCSLEAHSDDPVPLIIANSSFGKDGCRRFTEKDGSKGSLGILKGEDVLTKVIDGAR